jgi:hypothetical protein
MVHRSAYVATTITNTSKIMVNCMMVFYLKMPHDRHIHCIIDISMLVGSKTIIFYEHLFHQISQEDVTCNLYMSYMQHIMAPSRV